MVKKNRIKKFNIKKSELNFRIKKSSIKKYSIFNSVPQNGRNKHLTWTLFKPPTSFESFSFMRIKIRISYDSYRKIWGS